MTSRCSKSYFWSKNSGSGTVLLKVFNRIIVAKFQMVNLLISNKNSVKS
jgi:hypothetical protein